MVNTISSSTDNKSSIMCGLRKLFRIVFRIVLVGALSWFILALLWALLPFPTTEHDGDNGFGYPTAVLRSGKTLTRVYNSNAFRISQNYRQAFALDYKLDVEGLTIDIGSLMPLPIRISGYGNITKDVQVLARIGDMDGANLPWFPFADSVLLYSRIHKEELSVPVSIHWTGEKERLQRMEVYIAQPQDDRDDDPHNPPNFGVSVRLDSDVVHAKADLLLTVEMLGEDKSTITITAPEIPLSSSPSSTYPIRVAIINIIAPIAVFVNDLLGNAFRGMIGFMVDGLAVVFAIVIYVFMTLAVVFSIWRVLRGQTFEETVERMQARLATLSQNERLRLLRLDALRDNLELLNRNERFKAAVNICRNGWHPERDRVRAAEEEEADTEKGLNVEAREGDEKAEDTSSKL